MPERPYDEDLADALRFFGTVTASVSHELNNVNSAIEQIAGLLADHLTQVEAGGAFDPRRLQDVHARIVRQTRRAAGVIERLNRFAHSADDPAARFELNAVLGNLVGVCGRLAEMRRVELSFAPAPEEIWLTGDPFLLSQAVFDRLRGFWETAPAGAALEVSAGVEGEAPLVRIRGPRRPPPDAGVAAFPPDRLAARLGADIDLREDGDRQVVTIAWPAKPR